MVIDLFKDRKILKDFQRSDNYVSQRDFVLDEDVNKIVEHLSIDCNTEPFLKFKQEALTALQTQHSYIKMGQSSCDSHFSLELLGVGKNCEQYLILLDFSECLDYVLHLMSKCSTESVRRIPNYAAISRALLNNDFQNVNEVTYSVLMGIDPLLDKYLEDLYWEISDDCDDLVKTDELLLRRFLVSFYSKLLEQAQVIKAYIMVFLRQFDTTFRYRSKSFAASLGTSSKRYEDLNLILKNDGYEDYHIKLQVFEKYEYIKFLTEKESE